eukprot:5439882-Amphidinium_carterae.1
MQFACANCKNNADQLRPWHNAVWQVQSNTNNSRVMLMPVQPGSGEAKTKQQFKITTALSRRWYQAHEARLMHGQLLIVSWLVADEAEFEDTVGDVHLDVVDEIGVTNVDVDVVVRHRPMI